MTGPIDAEQLGRLLDEHGAALALYAAQWTDAADDCVQEALVELARQRQSPEHVVAWLYRVVKHRALNAARGDRRRRERESRAMAERFPETAEAGRLRQPTKRLRRSTLWCSWSRANVNWSSCGFGAI